MKYFIFLFVFCINALTASADASQRILSLPEAIEYALSHSLILDKVLQSEQIAKLENATAHAWKKPTLSFEANNVFEIGLPLSKDSERFKNNVFSPWSSRFGLKLDGKIYDGGLAIFSETIADLKNELAEINVTKTRNELILRIASEFYRYSLAVQLLKVRQQQLVLLEKQFKNLEKQYKQGFKTKRDFLGFQTQLQRANIDVVVFENNVSQSEQNLRHTIGFMSYSDKYISFLAITPDDFNKNTILFPEHNLKIEESYEYRMAAIEKKIADIKSDLVKKTAAPQIYLSSNVGYFAKNSAGLSLVSDFNQNLTWTTSLGFSYVFWDWGNKQREIEISERNRLVLRDDLNEVFFDLETKIFSNMNEIKKLKKNYILSKNLLVLEEENTNNLQTQYRQGTVNYLDLSTGFNALLDAKTQFYSLYFQSLQAALQYYYYEGTIYDTFVKK